MARPRVVRDNEVPIERRVLRASGSLLLGAEHFVYAILGAALVVTALMVLAGTVISLYKTLVGGVAGWEMDEGLFSIIDRLLYVLMLAEVIYTVRVTLSSGHMLAEPFLVVALIATIRRVLVITLTHSQAGPDSAEGEALFRHSMTELVVLGGLIMVLVISIYALRRHRSPAAHPSEVPEIEAA